VVRDEFPPAWLKKRGAILHQRGVAAFRWVWRAAAPAGGRGLPTIQSASRNTFARLYATPWQALARRHWKLLLLIVAVIMVGIIWKVPQWQAAGWRGQMEPKDLAKLQNDARTTLVQALGGAVLLIGLYFTLRNLQLTQDKQITEHYTRAVEQLGSDKLELRLGGIYALERIARDSERDHWPIMEILTAYVREHAPWKGEEQHSQIEIFPSETQPMWDDRSPPKLATDIQAILTVVGRRTRTFRKGEVQPLHLGQTDLRGAWLPGAHLEGAFLARSHLDRVDFRSAQLEGVNLASAYLEGADFVGAQLQGALLMGAHLEGAWLAEAHLEGAKLGGVHLEGGGPGGSPPRGGGPREHSARKGDSL
jgi:Pentapeptide repeats (8 copies)